MIERPRQQRPHAWLQAIDQRAQPLRRDGLLRGRRVASHSLGMSRGAGCVDHVLWLRQRWAVVWLLPFEPGFKIGGEIRRGEKIGVDLVRGWNFGRRRGAQHGDVSWNRTAKAMQ